MIGKSVFVVSKNSDEKYVMKILEGGLVNDEIKIGLTLGKQCPYLVRVFEVFSNDDEEDGELYMIMEYCDGGDLSKRIQKNIPPSDLEIYRFVFEGAQAIDTLHKNNIIHRDIKPGNFLLLKNGGFKLADYGVARILSLIPSFNTMTRAGSEGYVCPEILNGEKTYTMKADIFSFGVTLLEFMLGWHPFSNSNRMINTQSILSGTPIDAARNHPHPCAQLALRMLSLNPAARPNAADILAASLPLLMPLHALVLENIRLKEDVARLERESAIIKTSTTTAASSKTTETSSTAASIPNLCQNFPVVFLPRGNCAAVTNTGSKLFWSGDLWNTFYVDPAIAEGIYSFSIDCVLKGIKHEFGVCEKGSLNLKLNEQSLMGAGACCTYNGKMYVGKTILPFQCLVWKRRVTLTLELNADRHTLYYVVNGVQAPFVVSNVPSQVHFAVSGGDVGFTIELNSIRKLTSPSINVALASTILSWKN